LLLAGPPIQLHGRMWAVVVVNMDIKEGWVGCIITMLCAPFYVQPGSRGVGAMFLNLRMLSKGGISHRSHMRNNNGKKDGPTNRLLYD